MLIFWKESPFFRLLIPFILGIIIYNQGLHLSIKFSISISFLFFIAILLFGYSKDFFQLKFAWLQGIFIHLFIFSCGVLLSAYHDVKNSQLWYGHYINENPQLLIQVKSAPEEKEKTFKIDAEVCELINDKKRIKTKGDIILYFQKNEKSQHIKTGSFILINNKLQAITSSGNPGSFDYANYCANQNIYHRAFIKPNEWVTLDSSHQTFQSFFQKLNERSRDILTRYIKDSNALGIAEALLVGYRLDIDDMTWQAYTNTGIVHIIAISGMHMAMIYKTVLWLLLLIPFMKKNKKISIIISVVLMWVFACITGLPASVVRAASMFTIIAFGDIQDKKSNTLNMLFASAFLMLSVNPSFLMDVGFQLSFLAVLSLILFYQPIYEKIIITNKLLDLVWQLIAVTLAAQILTFPVCLYYFHQFPLLFLITNLVAVPLTTLVLYLEIVMVSLSFNEGIASFLGKLINEIILKINAFVFYLSHLKFSVWSGIHISLIQMFLLYALLTLIVLWFIQKKVLYFISFIGGMLVLSISFLLMQIEIFQQHKIIVYNISKQKSLEFLSQNQFEYIHSEKKPIIKKDSIYTLIPAHTFHHTKESKQPICLKFQNTSFELFSFRNKIIARIEDLNFYCQKPIAVDFLIISNKCKPELDFILKNITPQKIILDASIPFWQIDEWSEKIKTKNIPFHSVPNQGAFVADI